MTRISVRPTICVLTLTLLATSALAEDWPCWRGPRSDGSSLEKNVPIRWDGERMENIAWKTAIPGRGHASPIVSGDRLFLVTCREDRGGRVLLCLDREDGRILWQRVVLTAPLEKMHRLNSHASSTPATDGKLVYVSFLEPDLDAKELPAPAGRGATTPGDMVVAAYDFNGKQRWLVRPGRFSSRHGYCSPPLLFKNLVIVNGDHDGDGYLVALDRSTGKTVWKRLRVNHTRSYCPPIIREIGGRTQMVLSGSLCVASYDPHDGSRHWIIDGPTEQYVASMVCNDKLFFITAGYPEFHILAIRPDGHGNVTDTHVVWRTTKGCSYVPSPIVADDGKYFLIVSDTGIASCFEAATGERFWMKRIGPHYSASLVKAEGLVHFLSDEGVTTIVRPGPEFESVAENSLGENCYGSPAISGGRIYVRAQRHLYCIGGSGSPSK